MFFGAGGRTRTGTLSPAVDFESTTSTNSITPAEKAYLVYNKIGFYASILFSGKGKFVFELLFVFLLNLCYDTLDKEYRFFGVEKRRGGVPNG